MRWINNNVWDSIWKHIQDHHRSKYQEIKQIMVDASHMKAHQHASGAQGGNQAIGLTKGGRNTKLHAAVDQDGFPLGFLVTSGEVADCTQIEVL